MILCIPYILWTLLGLAVGSFLNVLIFRLPKGEEVVKTPSHCMSCGRRLRLYELIPVLSFVIQRGRCRSCGAEISWQYPVVEALNGAVWLGTALLFRGDPLYGAVCCVLFSALCAIAVIDWRTFEIPDGLSLAVFALGLVLLFADPQSFSLRLIGMFAVSGFFLILWLLTGGEGIGLGDVKLMAGAGLLLGWKNVLLSMIIGSVSGLVIHLVRMSRGAGRKLAFGPYLAAGIWISALAGDEIIGWYLGLFGL